MRKILKNSLYLFLLVFIFSLPLSAQNWKKAADLNKSADQLISKGKFQSALEKLKEAVEIWPDGGFYLTKTGWIYLWHLKDPDKSLEYYLKAYSNGGKENPWTLRELGFAYLTLRDRENSEKYTKEAIEKSEYMIENSNENPKLLKDGNSHLFHSLSLMANIHAEFKEWEESVHFADLALSMNTKDDKFYAAKSKAISSLWLGHYAFSEKRYSSALEYYKSVLESTTLHSQLKEWLDNYEINNLIKIVERRSQLKEISPEYTHKVLAFFIKNTDVKFVGLKGERIESVSSIQKDELEIAYLNQKLIKEIVESLSDGKFTLSFENQHLDSTLYDIDVSLNSGLETRQPIYETIQPSLNQLYYQNISQYDTFMLYWNGEGFATTANGGGKAYPYLDYHLYSKYRGYISFPTNFSDGGSYLVLLHEFFHNIEAMVGLKPAHGFLDSVRKNFPAWKGKGQLDYYAWHFRNTLPVLQFENQKDTSPKWSNLNWKSRYPEDISTEEFQSANEEIQNISRENLKLSYEYSQKGNELYWKLKKKSEAEKQYTKALESNPYNQDALKYFAIKYKDEKDYKRSREYLEILISSRPEPWIYLNLAWILHWKEKDLKSAIQTYEKFFQKFPEKRSEQLLYYGRALLEQGDFSKALDSFTEGSKSSDKSYRAQCLFWKGFVLGEKMGKKKDALSFMEQAYNEGYQDNFVVAYLNKYRDPKKNHDRSILESSEKEMNRGDYRNEKLFIEQKD